MGFKETIKENKVPIIIGATILVIAIFYFTGKKLSIGSRKESGDTSGEDKKGGLLFDKGKDYADFKLMSGIYFNDPMTSWVRFYKDGRFKIIGVVSGKTIFPSSASHRGTYKQDGKFLTFEDGKSIQGTSLTDIIDILKGMTVANPLSIN